MSLPRYPEYKPSGVEWLGEVPKHWDVLSLKRNFKIIGGSTPKSEIESFWNGDILWATPSDLSKRETVYINDTQRKITVNGLASCGTSLVPENSIILSTRAPIGSLAIATTAMCTNQGCKSLVPAKHANTEYCADMLSISSEELNIRGKGTTFLEISGDELGTFKTPAPSIAEQTQIAAFLDRETAKIDELVAEQRRLMELLKEKRQAVISHAVTKGLNPDAPIKPSGIEWLGDVPEHWKVKATKRLFKLIVEPAPDDNNYELLSIYTEIGVRPRKSLEAKGNKATTTDGYWMVQKGDLIVNKLLAWMGAIGISNYDGVTSPAYDILRRRIPLDPSFYDFLFRCGICFSEFRRYSRGIMDMRLRLYFEELGQLFMPYPPEQEQRQIVNYLQEELAKFDELSLEAQRAIDLLQERRTALISAAVTGQIDVR